jgi:hypothetical protein
LALDQNPLGLLAQRGLAQRLGTQHAVMTGGRGDHGTVHAHRARAQMKLADQLLHQRREELLAQKLRVQLNELANRAVIGLHPAAHPQPKSIRASRSSSRNDHLPCVMP